jgi:hypothetical protein
MEMLLAVLAVLVLAVCIGCHVYGRSHVLPGFMAFFRKKRAKVLAGLLLFYPVYSLLFSNVLVFNPRYQDTAVLGLDNPTVSLDRAKETLEVGASTSFSASTRNVRESVQWTTDNPMIVTVTNDGAVTALAVGTARVTARADEASATAIITVIAANNTSEQSTSSGGSSEIAHNDTSASPDAALVAETVLSLNEGEKDEAIMLALVVSGKAKTQTDARAIVDAAKAVKLNVDGMVDTGVITPDQAHDPEQLAQIADVFIQHGYTVAEFKELEMSGVMELPEYGQAFGEKDNFKGNITADNSSIAVLVWGDVVTVNGSKLGKSVVLVYPQVAAAVEIGDGGYRPFATNPDMSIAHWQARLLADASLKMGGGAKKYILSSAGLEETDGIITEVAGTAWVERADKPGEYLLPDENAGQETLVKIDGTVQLSLDAAAICDADGSIIYEIRAQNSVPGKDYYGETVQVDNGAPDGWTIEYSRDGRILGVQGNGYLMIRDGKATYWQGFSDMIFNYGQ